jgi:hypothetical protein
MEPMPLVSSRSPNEGKNLSERSFPSLRMTSVSGRLSLVSRRGHSSSAESAGDSPLGSSCQIISSSVCPLVSLSDQRITGKQKKLSNASQATASPTEPSQVDSCPTKAGDRTMPVRPNKLLTTVLAVPRILVGKISLVIVAAPNGQSATQQTAGSRFHAYSVRAYERMGNEVDMTNC